MKYGWIGTEIMGSRHKAGNDVREVGVYRIGGA